jgi:hypothetical protein
MIYITPLQDSLHHDHHLGFVRGHPSQEETYYHVSHLVQTGSAALQLLSETK